MGRRFSGLVGSLLPLGIGYMSESLSVSGTEPCSQVSLMMSSSFCCAERGRFRRSCQLTLTCPGAERALLFNSAAVSSPKVKGASSPGSRFVIVRSGRSGAGLSRACGKKVRITFASTSTGLPCRRRPFRGGCPFFFPSMLRRMPHRR
uniref:Uncharacterized protein n=1 Tax=Ixodes ricinus TaxID=34613 RepID=A0A6B0UUM7_IXORI